MRQFLEKNSFYSISLFLVSFYFITSLQEYFMHKYIMHNKINIPYLKETYDDHIKHHISTNKDFTIKDNDHSNICFSFMTMLPIFFVNVFILYILFYKIISLHIIVITVIIAQIIFIVIWNSLHSYIHFFSVNKICKNTVYGIPPEYINPNNIYVKWSLENHKAHHYYKKDEKGNYNVVFPGADYLLGTYNTMPITK